MVAVSENMSHFEKPFSAILVSQNVTESGSITLGSYDMVIENDLLSGQNLYGLNIVMVTANLSDFSDIFSSDDQNATASDATFGCDGCQANKLDLQRY